MVSSLREFGPLRPSECHLGDLRVRVGGGNGLGMFRWSGHTRARPGRAECTGGLVVFDEDLLCKICPFFILKLGCRPFSFTLKGFQKGVRCENPHHQIRFRGSQNGAMLGGVSLPASEASAEQRQAHGGQGRGCAGPWQQQQAAAAAAAAVVLGKVASWDGNAPE